MKIEHRVSFLTVDLIKVGPRLREIDMTAVHAIAESFKALGQLHPIRVDKMNNLIFGAHRLEAAKLLGWVEIFGSISDDTPENNKLAEFDENLMQAQLKVVERALQLRERKRLYEELFPQTKNNSSHMMSMIRRAE